MKKVNAYYRKHKTCQGCEGVSEEQAAELDESMKNAYSWETAAFPSYAPIQQQSEYQADRGPYPAVRTRPGDRVSWLGL